jgi:hypothetical protein
MNPPAIIYINGNIDGYTRTDADGYPNYWLPNGDIDSIGKNTISTQLRIDEVISYYEFGSRMIKDPNYANKIHLMGYRILVIANDFSVLSRQYADAILYVKGGVVTIEKDNTPGLTLNIQNLDIYKILRYNSSEYVVCLPITPSIQTPITLAGIFAMSGDSSGIHDINPDNEYNNDDFKNR